jgi:Mrp family chromosome partitioning ATPase
MGENRGGCSARVAGREDQSGAQRSVSSSEGSAAASDGLQLQPDQTVRQRLFADLRRIWENLLLRSEEGVRSVLFCGATRGEGATFVAYHMAQYLAEINDLRTLYVDTNLDCPKNDVLPKEITPDQGLLSHICGGVPLEVLIQGTFHPKLYILPAGGGSADDVSKPALLNRPTVERLLRYGKDSFDCTILNGQPVTTHPLVIELARLVDRVALVCRYGWSRREVSQQAVNDLMEAGVTQVGVILNDRQYPIPSGLYKVLK